MLKRPGAAKALGAIALADVVGRQFSPKWAALVAGWYPAGSASTASVVAPLRTIEEVRARGIKTVSGAVAQPVSSGQNGGATAAVLQGRRTIHSLAGLLSL